MSLRDGEIKAPQADQVAATAKPSGTAEQPPWKMRENPVVIVNRCPVVSPSGQKIYRIPIKGELKFDHYLIHSIFRFDLKLGGPDAPHSTILLPTGSIDLQKRRYSLMAANTSTG
ncbi:hypothetical protein SDJN02_12825, partial [Cucurbita argyrosperma subsp. argyrosperma]